MDDDTWASHGRDDVVYRLDLEAAGPDRDGSANRRGLRARDKPFQPWLTLSDPITMAKSLGLPRSAEPLVNQAMWALVAGLISLEENGDGDWLFYSRDNDHYSGLGRHVPRFYRRPIVVKAVDRLADAGLIDHHRIRPSPQAHFRSRIQASDILRAQIAAMPATATTADASEVIILRGVDGRPINYPETKAIAVMRRDVLAHNAFLQQFDATLSHPEAGYDRQGYLIVRGKRLNPTRTTSRRIFKGNFSQGGRWYGGWWQNVPSDIRAGLRVNGEPTCELDIRGCHMRLLCARAGVELGDGDPYGSLGLPRDDIKLGINVMLNARSWQSARAALVERLAGTYGPAAGAQADDIRKAVQIRLPGLQPYLNSGVGLKLQRMDADICARVQRHLRERGIPCLSVHDSYITPEAARDVAARTMDDQFERTCQQLRTRR